MDAPLVWLVVSVVRLRGEHIAAKLSSKIEDLSSALTRGTPSAVPHYRRLQPSVVRLRGEH